MVIRAAKFLKETSRLRFAECVIVLNFALFFLTVFPPKITCCLTAFDADEQEFAPIAQGIEHWSPEPCAEVRVLLGALSFLAASRRILS